MAGDKTYITDDQGKLHRATRVHAVTPTDIVWSSNPNDYTVQVKIDGKWHRAVLTMDAGSSTFFDNINIDKALVTGADGKQHTALIVKPESTVTLSDIKTDTHGTIAGTTTGETAVSTYSENWSNVKWQDNVNVYKVLVTGSDGKVHTALLTTSVGGGVQVIVLGASPLVLPDAIANSLSYVKAFGGTEQRNIPQPYTQVNYVTNTAQTAVDTGIMIDFAKNYEFEVECRAVSGSWYILQSRASASGNVTGIHGETSGSNIKLVVGNVTVCTSAITRTVGNKLYVKATLNAGTATLYVKDETANTEDTQTGSYGTTQPNPTAAVYLLGNAGGQYVDVNSDIYMARIKENGVTVMDYVPARQAATAGFYDKASGTFKTALTPANLSADGNTVPTPDAPMDIVSNNGVLKLSPNLYKPGIKTEYTANGVTISVDADGLLHLDGSPTSAIAIIFTGYDGSFANGFTFSTHLLSGTVSGANSEFYPSSSVGYNPTIKINTYGTSTRTEQLGTIFATLRTGDTFNNAVIGIQILSGIASSMPTYHPYGSVYADGTVETINVHGKNLCNLETPYVVTISTPNYTDSLTPTWCKFKENTRYTITYRFTPEEVTYSAAGNLIFSVVTYTDGTIDYNCGIKDNSLSSGIATYTTTAGKTIASIVGLYRHNRLTGGTITINSMQIEEGTTSTDYEPYYDGGTATAEMLLKVGDYQDVQSIIDGAVTRNVGVKVLDGTENYYVSTGDTYGVCIPNNILQYVSGESVLCSHLPYSTSTSTTQQNVICNRVGVYGLRFLLNPEIMPDTSSGQIKVDSFKQWLAAQYAAGTPVIVVYPLATPTTESVAGQTLQVQDGDNTLEITQASLTGLELEAEYTKTE